MIKEFKGEYRWLSNFWMATVIIDGLDYPSNEHYYQAMKFSHIPEVFNKIRRTASPGETKRISRKYLCRKDWNDIRLDVMYTVNKAKYTQHLDLKEKLIKTFCQPLIEGNTWGDTYWGVCNGIGENHLGKILMRIRNEIKT